MRTLLAILLLTIVAFPGNAAKEQVLGMSERAFKVLDQAQVFIDAGDYAGARGVLGAAMERRLSSYERAHMLNVTGYTWYEQNNLERALGSYREALTLEELPNSMLVTLRLSLGQLNLIKEDYSAAEEHLRELLLLADQDTASNRVLLAAALIGQERYEDALKPLRTAIDEKRAEGEVPPENWLSMLSSVYFELDDYPAMLAVVEQLAIHYTREQYLINLAALHGQLGDTGRQLALIESLLDKELLHQSTHLQMIANLYLGESMPHKAATLLQQEMDAGRIESTLRNLELLSQAWYMSAEPDNAIAPLAKAAELSESGDLYLRLARLHMDAYRWQEAGDAARAALEKGGLRQEGQAWLLRGMAEVRLQQFTEARQRFRKAANYDDTRKYATQWLSYLNSEEARIAATGN